MITGDMNARTGVLPDFVPNDPDNYIPLPLNYIGDACVSIPRM